jgi:hypothetical protein
MAAGQFALVGGHSRTATVFSTQPHSRLDSRIRRPTTSGEKRVIPLNLPVGDPTHDTQTERTNAVTALLTHLQRPERVVSLRW